jgi:hypothetical protein
MTVPRVKFAALLACVVVGACLAAAMFFGTAPRLVFGNRSDKVSFYFAAHEDDSQLFMNPSAFEDVVSAAAKTVFVHITAGDAGLGTGSGDRKNPYYLARENGADAAIRFMVSSAGIPAEKSASHDKFNEHLIYRIAYRNAVGYFMRLPDGNVTGGGYPGTGFLSLKRFAGGEIATFPAIDGSTTYNGWRDFVDTLRTIVEYERGNATFIQINIADPDPANNPKDHPDHLATAKAALDAVSSLSCVRRVYYADYVNHRRPANLGVLERDKVSSVLAVTLAAVTDFGHPKSWRHYDELYVGKSYFRIEEPHELQRGQCGVITPGH